MILFALDCQLILFILKLAITGPLHKMSSSVGGFSAPGMITHYCLRTPEEVSSSSDNREFTPLAVFSPLLSLIILIATYMAGEPEKKVAETAESTKKDVPDEETPLIEKNEPRRRSTDPESEKKTGSEFRQKRRRTLADCARSASIRGSMLTPMTIIPPNGSIYGDNDDDDSHRIESPVV